MSRLSGLSFLGCLVLCVNALHAQASFPPELSPTSVISTVFSGVKDYLQIGFAAVVSMAVIWGLVKGLERVFSERRWAGREMRKLRRRGFRNEEIRTRIGWQLARWGGYK